MLTEFVSVQFSREELRLLHTALIQRAMIEDELRSRDHQPSEEFLKLLSQIEMLLGERMKTVQQVITDMHNDLWEYAWCVFTDEWAYFRAHQDVYQELRHSPQKPAARVIERLVETQYQKHFDRYVAELDMHTPGCALKGRVVKENKRPLHDA